MNALSVDKVLNPPATAANTFYRKATKKLRSYSLGTSFGTNLGKRLSVSFLALTSAFVTPAHAEEVNNVQFPDFSIKEIATGLDTPWAMVTLPNDDILVTELSGDMHLVSSGKVSAPLSNVPQVFARSQGGLMDVLLHPDYESNGWIYFTYAFGNRDENATRLARAKLSHLSLTNVEVLFTVSPTKNTPVHYGGRIAFMADNTLLLTTGDGFDYRESAQKLDSLLGKVIRLNDDGSVPTNNPFVNHPSAKKEIFSYGHRNPQGIAVDRHSGTIFENEHGPKGGDEVNILAGGKNYGWPVITNGVDYSGALITPFKHYTGMEQPLVDWTPSIAPSSLAIHYGSHFNEINGDLLVTSLKDRALRWINLEKGKVIQQTTLLTDLNLRLRDVHVDKQGNIFVLTNGETGKILKLVQ